MKIHRVAVVFDNQVRFETTGLYCRRALGKLVNVEHFVPLELSELLPGTFDLFLYIDDGLDIDFPQALRPSACWIIDTHVNFAAARKKCAAFDLVFAAQREGAAQLREAGVDTAEWLPLACDPDIHRQMPVDKEFDACFVGNFVSKDRERLVASIQREFPKTFVGRRYLYDMAEIYSASTVIFNRSLRHDINMRVFEALSCGSLLLTDDLGDYGLDELFRDGKHLAAYRTDEEVLDKLRYYLQHDGIREQIAGQGRAEAHARHTYLHRMARILARAESGSLTVPSSGALQSDCTIGKLSGGKAGNGCPETALRNCQEMDGRHCAEPGPGQWKEPGYFEFSRPELLDMVPLTARRVLDIGCGTGRLGEAIQRRQKAEVWGIEINPHAARQAERRLEHVILADAQGIEPDAVSATFDCIVCGDILEHLRDPLQLLTAARAWLSDCGELIASVPNVRHHSVISSLLDGNWTYEQAGLLDEDHVRFFTKREIEKLFFRAGYQIAEMRFVPGSGYDDWVARGKPAEVRIGPLQMRGIDRNDAEEFFAYQYLTRAVPIGSLTTWGANGTINDNGRHRFGLTSIIIVTHNQLSYTRQCIGSIRQFTQESYEIIFIDNGSTDGTAQYLESIPGAAVVLNHDNRGFPAAVNQGLGMALGQQVLLLNNDVVVTTGWLHRMLVALHRDARIGLVGPCSNNVSGPQQIPVSYGELSMLDGFAWQLGKHKHGQIVDVDRLVGFCLLISRKLIDDIGSLDERFGIGCFEDDDYCRRAIERGYRAVIAEDAFVHHFGSRTFRGSGVDLAAVLRANQRKYEDKWASAGEAAPRAASAPDKGSIVSQSAIGLSLCMIVRDNERTIEAAIRSIAPWVNEINVVDTGSNDRTPEICEALGARVFRFDWCDDFSAARNESLRHARGEWIFWMDSDDTIDEENGRKLRALSERQHGSDTLGYIMQVRCPGASPHDVTVVDHVKLFRNRPDLRFEFRIHEQIIPAIRRAGGNVEWTDIFVTHSGADQSADGRQRKLERDFRILHGELDDQPNHPFVLFNLGMTYADAQRYEDAVRFLRRSLEVARPEESQVRKAYALLVHVYLEVEQEDQAWDACSKGLQLFPGDTELLFRAGMIHHKLGRFADAEAAYLEALRTGGVGWVGDPSYVTRDGKYFSSLDAGLAGFKARHNLALVYESMGQYEKAEAEWRSILEQMTDYAAAWEGLGRTLLERGQIDQALSVALQMRDTPNLKGVGHVLVARVCQRNGDILRARGELEIAIDEAPEDVAPLQELCRLLFEHGELADAERRLRQLIARSPDDAAGYHNLGTILIQLGQNSDAVDAYRHSLQLRPRSVVTWRALAQALQRAGRWEEATQAWRELLALDPGDNEASAALRAQPNVPGAPSGK